MLPVDENGQKLTETGSPSVPVDFEPYEIGSSPDGRSMIVLQPSEPGGIPYIFHAETQNLEPLFRQEPFISGAFFGWHPDSRQVLFWSLDAALWLVNVESGETTTLAAIDGPIQGATISPDGQQVIYIAHSDTSYRTMWKVSAASGDARPLFDLGGASYIFGWSPDGRYILYMGGPGVQRADDIDKFAARGPLWIVDPEGNEPRPLVGPFISGAGFEPVWSPDSQWVAYTGLDKDQEYGCTVKGDSPPEWPACRFEGAGIYVENVTTGEVRRLAAGIEQEWSPDGAMLAFLSNQGGNAEVWVVGIDGSGLQQMTTETQMVKQVTWASTP